MPIYKLKLDTLRCIQPRSAGQYHDTVTVLFYACPAGKLPSDQQKLLSPIGIRGPRMDIHFGQGYSYKFERNDRAFGSGRNFDWELLVDLPDDSVANWEVGIVVFNDRDVDDPYAATKFITAVALAGASGAVGAALPEKGLVAIIAGGLAGMGGEALQQVVELFIDDWPKCVGMVFQRSLFWNAANFAENVGRMTLESGVIDAVPEGCHQPRYEMDVVVEAVSQWQFGASEQVTRTYSAVPVPGGDSWLGNWYEGPSSPFVGVSIERSTQGGPADYRVSIREEATYRRSRKMIVEGVFDPVPEVVRYDLPYRGETKSARATGAEIYVEPGRQTGTRTWSRGRGLGSQWRTTVESGALQVGTLLMANDSRSQLLNSFRSIENLRAVWAGEDVQPVRDLDRNDWIRMDMDALERVIGMSVTEEGASLYIPQHNILLRLYWVHEVNARGRRRRVGPLIRYVRDANFKASVADLQLDKHRIVR